ncbi:MULTISPECIES: tetratricopeptide repeat protein [unclassified Jeotgalicoccus]|uniref:tetratricopeptide repeat protein n=1 Tax=unclassified Jeotgalicoccus TaxID=2630462 RepID=UPI0014151581|nr:MULTISPECIES: tetratricopeptide repeat protein [unclassified Jeotgalicoccus]QQD85547.1 tetratricopeptide repeat protein [Jeotgalicoccus sp. ATCC 8456]
MFAYKTLIEKGDYEAALEEIFKAIDESPKEDTHYINGAVVLSTIGKIEEAERFLQQALVINPDSFSALYTLGNLYFDAERYNEARTVYLTAYGSKMDDGDLNFMLGRTHVNTGEIKMSIPFFEKAYQSMPDDTDLLFNYGLALCQVEQYVPAVKLLSAVTEKIDHADAEYNLGLAIYMLTEDKSKATEHFKKATEIQADHHLSHHALKKFNELE